MSSDTDGLDEERETACSPLATPPELAALVDGCAWVRDRVGASGAAVYRLQRPGVADLYLKHAQGPAAAEVREEMSRLRWLGQHIPVPEVRGWVCAADETWLLMSALCGRTAWQVLRSDVRGRVAVVDGLARFVRLLHALPVRDCPFDSGHLLRLAAARARVEAGLVDVDDFDEGRRGWSAAQVLERTLALLPLPTDCVVTHGDFSLDNIIMQDGEVAGCVDVSRAGIADRYQDLAILWNCLGDFGAPLQQRLLSSYGLDDVDERRLQFHLLLDELF